MNVNFIRTGVLISMNLDPEGVIAAANNTYDGVYTHTYSRHINTYYIYLSCNFFFPHPTRNGFRSYVCTSPVLIVAADLTDTNIYHP